MQLASTQKYFQEDEEPLFEGAINAMQKGINAFNTVQSFTHSANQIIGMYNSTNLERHYKEAQSYIINDEIQESPERATKLADNLGTFVSGIDESHKNYEAYKPIIDLQRKLYEMRDNFVAKENEPVQNIEKRNSYDSYDIAVENSFKKGVAFTSDLFSASQNRLVNNAAEASRSINKLNKIDSMSPTLENVKERRVHVRTLEHLYKKILPPSIKAKIYFQLYKNAVENNA